MNFKALLISKPTRIQCLDLLEGIRYIDIVSGNVEELNLCKTKMNEYTTSHLGPFSYCRSEKLSRELLVSYNYKLSCQVYFLTVYFSYNKRQLSRIYPKGTRVGSENYMPQVRMIYINIISLVNDSFQTF